MVKYINKIKIIFLINLFIFSGICFAAEIDYAKNNAGLKPDNGNTKTITIIIKEKGNNFIKTARYRFMLAEEVKITDINDSPVVYYKIPVPVKAKVLLQFVPDSDPCVLEIVIQEKIIIHRPR